MFVKQHWSKRQLEKDLKEPSQIQHNKPSDPISNILRMFLRAEKKKPKERTMDETDMCVVSILLAADR